MNEYTTASIDLASYIWAKGVNFLRTEEDTPGHFQFYFSDPTRCYALEEEFNNFGQVSARDLLARKKSLAKELQRRKMEVTR